MERLQKYAHNYCRTITNYNYRSSQFTNIKTFQIDRALLIICAVLFKTIFWTFSNLGFPGICSRNLSVSFFIRPSAPITTGKVLVIRCHIFSTSARRKNLLAFACLFTFYACLFIFCACLFTFFLGANHKAPTFHVTLW